MKNTVQYAMLRYLPVALLLLTAAPAPGSSKRTPLFVSVHLETDASEGPRFSFPIRLPGTASSRHFKKSAEVTDREIEWFYLFPAESGNGYGAALKFNSVGTNRLEYISSSNQGRHLLIAAHPGVSSFIMIDKVISDGIVVVWEGITEGHATAWRKHMQERTAAAGPAADPSADPSAPPESGEKKKKWKLFPG